MADSRNGGLVLLLPAEGSNRGGGENASLECSVSNSRIAEREVGVSHGGGDMFARRWRFSSRASQSGMLLL